MFRKSNDDDDDDDDFATHVVKVFRVVPREKGATIECLVSLHQFYSPVNPGMLRWIRSGLVQ